jgi:DNA-binding Lrp family transcriptional regulator
MKDKIDSVDLVILRELRDDCKRPVCELARKLSIHPNTLLQRIKKLEASGVIMKYTAELDYAKLDYDLHAIISMKVTKDIHSERKWAIFKELKGIKDIVALYAVTGTYDIVAIVKTKNRETLNTLLEEINGKNYVHETNTSLVLQPFKHAYEFNPF